MSCSLPSPTHNKSSSSVSRDAFGSRHSLGLSKSSPPNHTRQQVYFQGQSHVNQTAMLLAWHCSSLLCTGRLLAAMLAWKIFCVSVDLPLGLENCIRDLTIDKIVWNTSLEDLPETILGSFAPNSRRFLEDLLQTILRRFAPILGRLAPNDPLKTCSK